MYGWLRNTHLFLGIFSFLLLVVYGLSAAQMAHNSLFRMTPAMSRAVVRIRPENVENPRAVARELMTEHGMTGELTAVQPRDDGARFRIVRPGTIYDVDYSENSREARIRTTRATFMGFLNRIHHLGGLWHEYPALNAWGILIAVVSAGLVLIGLTGIYLWFQFHQERVVGGVLLGLSLSYSLTLVILMRLAR